MIWPKWNEIAIYQSENSHLNFTFSNSPFIDSKVADFTYHTKTDIYLLIPKTHTLTKEEMYSPSKLPTYQSFKGNYYIIFKNTLLILLNQPINDTITNNKIPRYWKWVRISLAQRHHLKNMQRLNFNFFIFKPFTLNPLLPRFSSCFTAIAHFPFMYTILNFKTMNIVTGLFNPYTRTSTD